MSKELELIAEVILEGRRELDSPSDSAAHVVSKLSEHGYSIVRTVAEPLEQLLVEFDYRSDGGPTRVGIFSSRLDAEAYVKSLGPIDAEWCVAPLAAAAAAEEDQ